MIVRPAYPEDDHLLEDVVFRLGQLEASQIAVPAREVTCDFLAQAGVRDDVDQHPTGHDARRGVEEKDFLQAGAAPGEVRAIIRRVKKD